MELTTTGAEMPTHLRVQFGARITTVVRALPLPEVLLNVQTVRWEFGASLEETVDAVAVTDPALSRDFHRWAIWPHIRSDS